MSFVDVTLLLSEPVEDGPHLRFALQLPAAGGEARITEPMARRCDLRRVAPAMAHPGPGPDGLLAAGVALGAALFPDLVAARLRRVITAARAGGAGVRIRLLCGAALQRLPWEYAILPPEQGEATPADFLALMPQVSLVRDHEGAPRPRWSEGPVRHILGCVAAPRTTPAIDVEHERSQLARAVAGRDVTVRWTERGTRPSSALAAADLFHFAGHGVFEPGAERDAPAATRDVKTRPPWRSRHDPGAGQLVFDDGAGGEDRVAAGDLAITLRALGVRVAVINACHGARGDPGRWWSSTAAALLHGGVPRVIAMQHALLDTSALAFTTALYGALAEGDSLDDAVRRGRLAVFDRDGFGWGTPVLYLAAEETVAISEPATAAAARPPARAPVALTGWAGSPRHLTWSGDGEQLAACDGNGSCAVWERGARWRAVRCLAVAAIDRGCGWLDTRLVIARGDRLYVAGDDVRELARLEHEVRCVLPLRSRVACIDAAGGGYLLDPDGRVRDRAPLGPARWAEAAVAPHDDTLAVVTTAGEIAVWGAGRRPVTAAVPERIAALAFADPGTLVAALASGRLAAFAIDKRRIVRIADLAGPAVRAPIALATGDVAELPTGDDVAVFRAAVPAGPGVTALVASRTRDDVRCLAWSPDRAWLAIGTAAITLRATG